MDFADTLFNALAAEATKLGRKLNRDEWFGVVRGEVAKIKKERKRADALPEAEQVYALFPKKVGRDEALRAITKQLKAHPLSYLLDKTNQFRQAVESWPVSYRYMQDGGDRCPHPATWFNQGRFADDPKEWRRAGARKPAEHQHISPTEPQGWRERFPDFLHIDKKWEHLDSASQQYIIGAMALGDSMSEAPRAEDKRQELRNA